MNRIVFWLAIVGFGFLVWRAVQLAQRKQQRWRDQRDAESQPGGAASAESKRGDVPGQLAAGEPMLKCAHCGIYLPASEAFERRGLPYCSPEHRDVKPT